MHTCTTHTAQHVHAPVPLNTSRAGAGNDYQEARQTRSPASTPCVPCPGAGNDYQKDLQFRKLNAQKDIIEIKVVRGGEVKVRGAVGTRGEGRAGG